MGTIKRCQVHAGDGSGLLVQMQLIGSSSRVEGLEATRYHQRMDYRANRKRNLQNLVQTKGGIRAFVQSVNARLVDEPEVSEKYIWQVLNEYQGAQDKSPRNLGDTVARRVERALELGDFWFDQDHSSTAPAAATAEGEEAPNAFPAFSRYLSALPPAVTPQVNALLQQVLLKSSEGKLSESDLALLISTVTQLSEKK